jgi:hypothetical protein
MPSDPPLTAFALNCTLKSSKAEEKSSTDKLIADMFAGMAPLSDLGFTIPANAGACWVGEAMGSTDYADLKSVPKPVQQTRHTLATNTAHLARPLKRSRYPGLAP